jgi:PAS domain S-box-containing protein
MIFALCNAGEALFIAWLVTAPSGQNFTLGGLRSVLGFLAATAVGTALSGIGGTAGFVLFHNSGSSSSTIWFNWFASDALGVVTVAPLLIGLTATLRSSPERRQLIEGLLALAALALVSVLGFFSSTDHWFTILPLSLLLPLAYWVTARCLPVFSASAAFILAATIVWTITFGMGRLGDPTVPLADRVLAARTALFAMSSALILVSALFQEWRRGEAALKESKDRLQESNDRLQLALSAAKLGAFSIDLSTDRLECNTRAVFLHGHDVAPKTAREGRSFIHRDDLPHIDRAFEAALGANGVWSTEYRVVYPPGHQLEGEVRWVALDGSIVRGEQGQPARMLGVVRDATRAKLAEETLRNQEKAFRRLLEALPAAIHTTDTAGRITFCNKAAVDLWGITPELGKDKCSDLGRLFYPNGTLVPPDECPTKVCLSERRAVEGQEAIFERRDGKRIPIIPYPAPLTDERGTIVGVVSMKLDITERKQAQQALAERNAQLDLAHKAARVGSYTYDIIAGTMRISRASAAIRGLSPSTLEIATDKWGMRVHRDDIQRLRNEHVRAFKEGRREVVNEFRFVRPGGEVRWVEVRSLVAYDEAGRAKSMTGVYIDVTDRRKAEDQKNLLIAELDHRVKNVLACVAAVAQRSRECSRSADEFLDVLNGRINSLANAHALLSRSSWEGVHLGELVRNELAPCMCDNSHLIDGPDIVLAADATQPLAMVLHELATNASKYGALSNRGGQVSVRWQRQSGSNSHGRLTLEWCETGGPPIAVPGPSGYGSYVIRDLIPYELGGSVDYVLSPEGVSCRVEIPAEWLRNGVRPRSNHEEAALQLHAVS